MKLLHYFFATFLVLTSLASVAQSGLSTQDQDSLALHYQQVLTDSSFHYNFGYHCSFSGTPPMGRMAINYFVERMDSGTVRAMLQSDNRVGRVYALEAMLTWAQHHRIQLTSTDQTAMREVLNATGNIPSCYGCMTLHQPLRDVLPPELLNLLETEKD